MDGGRYYIKVPLADWQRLRDLQKDTKGWKGSVLRAASSAEANLEVSNNGKGIQWTKDTEGRFPSEMPGHADATGVNRLELSQIIGSLLKDNSVGKESPLRQAVLRQVMDQMFPPKDHSSEIPLYDSLHPIADALMPSFRDSLLEHEEVSEDRLLVSSNAENDSVRKSRMIRAAYDQGYEYGFLQQGRTFAAMSDTSILPPVFKGDLSLGLFGSDLQRVYVIGFKDGWSGKEARDNTSLGEMPGCPEGLICPPEKVTPLPPIMILVVPSERVPIIGRLPAADVPGVGPGELPMAKPPTPVRLRGIRPFKPEFGAEPVLRRRLGGQPSTLTESATPAEAFIQNERTVLSRPKVDRKAIDATIEASRPTPVAAETTVNGVEGTLKGPGGGMGGRAASGWQQQALETDLALAKKLGATDIRIRQNQVNAAGKQVGVNKPDLQFTLEIKGGKQRVYIEYDDLRPPSKYRGFKHYDRILANDPDAVIILRHE